MIKLILLGDVMLGRGIDQILRHPGNPQLYEGYVQSALDYVMMAEAVNGSIPRDVDLSYVWGDAADVIEHAHPDCVIANLETAITRQGRPEPKGINYRMHPANAEAIHSLGVDCWGLANNHTLDWGVTGLDETIATLLRWNICFAGAGFNDVMASAPARIELEAENAIHVFAYALPDSGVPPHWRATRRRPGINMLDGCGEDAVKRVADCVASVKRPCDLAVISLHWGGNWGYDISPEERQFAHGLIGRAGADLVHGHSSHHPKAWEVFDHKLILYGCGDFINDYEGIAGGENYRPDLALMYIAEIDPNHDGKLVSLTMAPFRRTQFRLSRASPEDARWLTSMLNRQNIGNGSKYVAEDKGVLRVHGIH